MNKQLKSKLRKTSYKTILLDRHLANVETYSYDYTSIDLYYHSHYLLDQDEKQRIIILE